MDKLLENLKEKEETKFPRIDLQLFAEGGDDNKGGTPSPEDDDKKEDDEGGEGSDNLDDDEDKKKFTQAELDDIVKKRLARERAKIEREYAKKEAKAKRLKDLSDEEKEIEELKIEKEELEAERLRLQRRELEMDAKDILIDKELPLEFLDFILGEDVESTKENIDKFEKQFKSAVSEGVKKLISTGGVKRSTTKSDTNLGVELGKQTVREQKKHNFF